MAHLKGIFSLPYDNRLSAGLEWRYDYLEAPMRVEGGVARDNTEAVYVQDEFGYKFSPKVAMNITGGLRLNNAFVAAHLECYLAQNHIHSANDTETRTPSYTLLNLSAGTDIMVSGRKVAELYVVANNLLDRAYQSHLSRLKYLDPNPVTGRQGVYNMGRNVTFKLVVPLEL